MIINKQKVVAVRRATWDPKDPRELRGVERPELLGRAHIELADGTRVVAPLFVYTDMARMGQTFALIFDETSGAFMPIPVGGGE